MRNSELCEIFVNGTTKDVRGNSMSIEWNGSRLYSYGTAIAQRLSNGTIIVNITKYSVTTSRHQYHLKWAIPRTTHVIETTKRVPMGTSNLTAYID